MFFRIDVGALVLATVLFTLSSPVVALSSTPDSMTQDPWDNRRYPVSGELLQDFAPPNADWLPGHRGIDLAASTGTPVFVPASGVVSFVGEVAGTPVVTIHHGLMRSTFQPVKSELNEGTPVRSGRKLGVIAADGGHCAARCLHWGLLIEEQYLDPRLLIERVRVRLVPEDF